MRTVRSAPAVARREPSGLRVSEDTASSCPRNSTASRAPPIGAALTGTALTGAALTGAALTGAPLTGAALRGTALRGTALTGALPLTRTAADGTEARPEGAPTGAAGAGVVEAGAAPDEGGAGAGSAARTSRSVRITPVAACVSGGGNDGCRRRPINPPPGWGRSPLGCAWSPLGCGYPYGTGRSPPC
ncbi:pentapeptide repeat-containing protein [Cryptosporangium sp. NPDC051539]|uniref:pentapeptide repeat-containing protein n=1 Tax=Cryptosporangium sp. NPDC051539 TaxID=3363962 RepID=UPI0037957F71